MDKEGKIEMRESVPGSVVRMNGSKDRVHVTCPPRRQARGLRHVLNGMVAGKDLRNAISG